MRIKSVSNEQLRKIGMPLGASVIAAVGTMFVPTGLLEMMTGATGLSELVPSTAAPLGDTARALIAFGAGAFTLAAASLVTFRAKDGAPQAAAPAAQTDRMDNMQTKPQPTNSSAAAKPSLADRIGNFRMPQIKLPKMPWIKGEGDVTELSDLPRIRPADAHPDAPSRRPLVATEDLPTLDLTELDNSPVMVGSAPAAPVEAVAIPAIDPAKWYGEIAASTASAPEPVVEPAVAPEAPVAVEEQIIVEEPAPVVAETPVAEQPAPTAVSSSQPSLDDMLARFEASIARRQAQLATPAVEEAPASAPVAVEPEPEIAEVVESEILPPVETAPEAPVEAPVKRFATPLSAIPNANMAADEMDSALAAALATLQRMNGTSR